MFLFQKCLQIQRSPINRTQLFVTSFVQPRQQCTVTQQASRYWSWSTDFLLPYLHFTQNCFGLLRSQNNSREGETLGGIHSQASVWELTLSALRFNACSTMSQKTDSFYQLTPSKTVHCSKSQIWLKCIKFQIFIPFYLLSSLSIITSGVWNSSLAARSSFAFTTPRSRTLSQYHRITSKQQSWLCASRKWAMTQEFPIFTSWLTPQTKSISVPVMPETP